MIPAEIAVFQEAEWPTYTTFMVFFDRPTAAARRSSTRTRTSASTPRSCIGNPVLASITAHEMFHSWNVKRLRPAEMVPYRYDTAEPTPWLWVSEGITDYYADLALVRGGVVDSAAFFETTAGKIGNVATVRRRSRSRMRRSRPGSIRPTAPATSTIRRARWPG